MGPEWKFDRLRSCLYFECKNHASGRLGRAQMLDGGGPLVAQMSEQDVAELASGAAAQRLQDGLVLAHRFAPALALAGKIGGITHAANAAGEIGVSGLQRVV